LRSQARVVLMPGTLLDAATDSRRIDEPIDLATELNQLVDRIDSGPGDLMHYYSLLPGDLVEQARLPDIGLPHDGNTTWTALNLVCRSWCLWNRSQNRIQQVTAPTAVQCRHREGLAKPELPHGCRFRLGALIIDLVGGQNHRLTAATQHLHDSVVDVLCANRCIDDKDHGIRGRDSEFGLLCDLRCHSLRIWCPASGAHPHKLPPATTGLIDDPATRHPRHVLDHSLTPTEHAIHQRRFTDIGSTNNRHHRHDLRLLDSRDVTHVHFA